MITAIELVECIAIWALILFARQEVIAERREFNVDTLFAMVFAGLFFWTIAEFIGVQFNYDLTFMESCDWYKRQSFSAGPLAWRCVNKSDQPEFEALYNKYYPGYAKVKY